MLGVVHDVTEHGLQESPEGAMGHVVDVYEGATGLVVDLGARDALDATTAREAEEFLQSTYSCTCPSLGSIACARARERDREIEREAYSKETGPS